MSSPHCTSSLNRVGPWVHAFAAFTALFFAVKTPAYTLEGPKWASGKGPTMQLELGTANNTLSDGNTSWNVAAAPVIDMWNQVLGSIQLGKVMNSTAAVSSGDSVNSMAFANTVFGSSFGSNTLAVTYYSYSGSTMREADILFNTAQQWDSYRGALRFGSNGYAIADIQRVALHELGHALGLGHPDQAGQTVDAVMNSVMSNRYTLSNDDISGVQSLYGAPTSSPTPTPTPTPSATPTPTPQPTATPTPKPTATPTPTPVPTGSPILIGRPTPTPAPTATPAPTPKPTATPTPSPQPTPTPTPVPTATPTPTPTSTPSTKPTISISSSPAQVHTGGTSVFTLTASAATTSPVAVGYTMSGSAVLGSNYSLSGTAGQVIIPAGATSATVTLTVLTPSSQPTVALMTLSAGTTYTVSSQSKAAVVIYK
jgi:outer membrane biosynthesis protein TonB